jgi:sugar phosphate isomerase/epimerase
MRWDLTRLATSRRSFMQLAVGTSACWALGWQRVAQAAERFGSWPIGIQSYSLRNFPADEAIRHIQGLGLHNVEFFGKHLGLDATDQQIADMLATLKRAEIALRAHGVNEFTRDHEKNRRVFEFAKKAGIRNITANPQPDSFASLDQLVEQYDIRICIHNHGPGALYDTLDDVLKAVEGHHRNIGACIDTGHTLRSNEDPIRWVQELGPRVFALHIKDVAEKKAQTHDVVIGESFLDLVGLFKSLKQIQFPADGSISLEYESNPDNPIDDIKQCLTAAEKAIQAAGV